MGVLGLKIFLGQGLRFSTLGCLKHYVKAVSRLTRKATVVTPDSETLNPQPQTTVYNPRSVFWPCLFLDLPDRPNILCLGAVLAGSRALGRNIFWVIVRGFFKLP